MDKQFVSLNQALGYLHFLNTDKQAFTDKEFKPAQVTNQKRIRQNQSKRLQNLSDLDQSRKVFDGSNTQQGLGRKTLNKNRAIKRIIQNSKQILENNYKYEEPPPTQKISYITQFNIYLKQYNRLSQQILAQEQNRVDKKQQSREEEQAKLQQVFKYTVSQDFRQMIEVSILKDKVNKNNLNMVMQTFKQCLVVLKNNQLRVYQGQDQDSYHRDIKLHQIENVDYFSQPFIFTVMTIVKDKSSGNQFLVFKFDTSQKQHKWDRAVYCNYIVKKSKLKGKYFLSEFPQKQGQKQNNQGKEHVTKKRQDFKSYDIDRKKIIKNIVVEREKQKQATRMASAGMDTQRDIPTTRDKMERFNTQNQITILTPTRENNTKNNMQSTKNTDQNKFFESNFKGTKKKQSDQAQNNNNSGANNNNVNNNSGVSTNNNNNNNNNENPNSSNKGTVIKNNPYGNANNTNPNYYNNSNSNPNNNNTNNNNNPNNINNNNNTNNNNNINNNNPNNNNNNINNTNNNSTYPTNQNSNQNSNPNQANNNPKNTNYYPNNPNNPSGATPVQNQSGYPTNNNTNNTNPPKNSQPPNPNNNMKSSQSKHSQSQKNNSPNSNKNPSQSQSQYFIKPNLVESEQQLEQSQSQNYTESVRSGQSKASSKVINPYTRRKIQLKQKHQNGILVQKVKFFIDKPKLVYLNHDELEYWDYQAQTLHKHEKKVIPYKDIKLYRVLKNKNCIIYIEVKNKEIQFCGKSEDIDDIVQWIQLSKKEKEYEESVMEKNQPHFGNTNNNQRNDKIGSK